MGIPAHEQDNDIDYLTNPRSLALWTISVPVS